jgi:hypothetical protein
MAITSSKSSMGKFASSEHILLSISASTHHIIGVRVPENLYNAEEINSLSP